MSTVWLYAIASVASISVLSLIGVTMLGLNRPRMMFLLMPLAAGAMLGNVIVHLLPEAFAYAFEGKISSLWVSMLVLCGFTLCFIMARVLHLGCHHSGGQHHAECDCPEDAQERTHFHIHPTGHMSILSHALDNFTDGVLIGSSYLISIPAGVATTLAVLLHEIPLEFGGFGVLVNAGFSPGRAVFINFLSALAAMGGTCLVLGFGTMIQTLPVYLTPFGAGIVLYITAAGLIPQLHEEKCRSRSIIQLLIMLCGIALMVAVKD
jgi:zinc and cadmium transporter